MSAVLRPVGYVGSLQRLTWSYPSASIQAYIWGAGGGGGGDEGSDDPGGNGGGGGFARYSFTANPGDVIDIAIGQGGQGGTRTPGSTVGAGGRSIRYLVFDTRDESGVVPVSDPRWSTFMNAHAVWDPGGPTVTPIFRSYTVNFPVTGYYVFQYSADDSMTVTLDGTTIINYGGFSASPPPFVSRLVTEGNHTVNISASNGGGDVAGVALTIDASYSGANGGAGSGGSNGGGSGGGGGGATVLLVNDTVVAVAGGGAGGGGAGGNGDTPGTSGPDGSGPWGWPSATNTTLAQNGQGSIVGGGGGGGGGGRSAGNGGRRGGASPSDPTGSADFNATAGTYGESYGPGGYGVPTGRTPGGNTNAYYTGSSVGGYGGTRWASPNGQAGGNGYAAFVMDISGMSVRDAGLWKPVHEQYIRDGGQWKTVKNVYVRDGGQWKLVYGTSSPTFSAVSGNWGQYSRASV